MAQPTTRNEFKEYILRKLGAPVIEINVADEQVDDRIEEAVSFWREYHYNGSQLIYLKHEITADDISNGYVTLPTDILGISGIFNINASTSVGSGMFNVNYQFVLNNVEDMNAYGMSNYYMTMQHIGMMQEVLVGMQHIRYNRHVNRLYIDTSKENIIEGNYVLIEAYDIIDPSMHIEVWSDRWLQNYAAQLVKEQWGSNLTKFTGMQLIGGVAFNGEAILSEAREERKAMEEEVVQNLQPLTFNFIG
jgi:hypothetical protein